MDFQAYLKQRNFNISTSEDTHPFIYSLSYPTGCKISSLQYVSQGIMRRIRIMDEYLECQNPSTEEFIDMLENLPEFSNILNTYSNSTEQAINDLKKFGSLRFAINYNTKQENNTERNL